MVRKKIRLIGMIVLLLSCTIWIGSNEWLAVTVMADDTPVKELELTGWLIDECCSGTKSPVSHTTECLRMESCAATGFGILETQKDGSFKFYKFDENGHNLAVSYLKKIVQKDNVTITVKGIWDGNILKVIALAEKK